MSELPKGWAFPELRKVIEMKYGKGLPEKSRVPGRYPVYGSNGIIGLHEAAVTHGSTIIVGRKGSIGEIHLSSTACWPIDTTYYIDDFHGQPKEFFVYLLKHLNLGSYNRATAIPGLTREEAYGISIPLPPLNEQRRIVAKLDSLFTRSRCAREELGRVSGLVQRYKQAVLAAACSGRLTADWRKRQNKNDDDWEDTTVAKLIDGIDAGINIKCEERPPEPHEFGLVKISAVTWGAYDDNKSKTIPPNQSVPESTRIREGDFLISRANTLELVGACVIVECVSRPVFLSDKVLRVLVREPYKKWLLYWLRSNNGRNQIEKLASGNQLSMRNLTQANLKAITLKLPNEDEINEIINRVEKLFKAIDLMEQEHQKASKLLDRLEQATLAKAFRGELVPQDPNDEPAAALLERIQAERQARPQGKAVKSKQSRGERRRQPKNY